MQNYFTSCIADEQGREKKWLDDDCKSRQQRILLGKKKKKNKKHVINDFTQKDTERN